MNIPNCAQLPVIEKNGLLLVGDPHVADVPPGQRLPGYREQILRKVRLCLEHAEQEGLEPVFLGDLFNWPRDNSNALIVELIELFRPYRPWVLVGNHDKYQARYTDDVSMAVLDAAGAVRLMVEPKAQFVLRTPRGDAVVVSVPDGHKLPKTVEFGGEVSGGEDSDTNETNGEETNGRGSNAQGADGQDCGSAGSGVFSDGPAAEDLAAECACAADDSDAAGGGQGGGGAVDDAGGAVCPPGDVIVLTHHNIRFPEFENRAYSIKELPGVTWLINGHIHRPQPTVKKGMTTWTNPGNITRLTFSRRSLERIPAAAVWTPGMDDLAKWVVPHLDFYEVFPEQDFPPEDTPAEDGESRFLQGLERLAWRRTHEGAGLKEFLSDNLDPDQPETELIWKLYEEAVSHDE